MERVIPFHCNKDYEPTHINPPSTDRRGKVRLTVIFTVGSQPVYLFRGRLDVSEAKRRAEKGPNADFDLAAHYYHPGQSIEVEAGSSEFTLACSEAADGFLQFCF